jgi:transcriptional regulator with XRE-family HTH domain
VPRRASADAPAQAFGDAIREVRHRRKETLEEVAGRITTVGRDGETSRMDAKYLAAIERGNHSPTISTAAKIARALEVPLTDLVRDL